MRLFFAVALGVSGCFSADDFSECTRAGDPCGRNQVCIAPGQCEFISGIQDARVLPDRGALDRGVADAGLLVIDEPLPSLISGGGGRVVVRSADLAGASAVVHEARTIEVVGNVTADGRGSPGGGGGGGGAAATTGPATTPGAGADGADDGGDGSGDAAGIGGVGAPGGGPGNARGGVGGNSEVADGRPGDEATFPEGCAQISVTRFRIGDGGGGGGGGRGAVPGRCVGGGGGGGGAGAAGGGAIVLSASERIVVRGVLSARGLQASASGGAAGGPACADCGDCPPGSGAGGPGSPAVGPGAAGDDGAGQGGLGGAGSGGMVLIEAPVIEFAPGAGIDVSGGGSAESGGLIALFGRIEGTPMLLGAAPDRDCR